MSGDIIYRHYTVAFIDVLGQKESFSNFDAASLKDNDPRLIEIHKQTALFVENLRSWFEDFFKAVTEETKLASQVPEAKRGQFKEMVKSEIKTYRFSDSILAFTSLQTEKYHSIAINSVYGILMASGVMMVLSLAIRKSFRAAIEVGIGTDLSNGEIYGPVSYKVYELENKIAQYPRIVIGDELCSYLFSLSKEIRQFPEQQDEDIKLCKILADKCLKMIIRDLDGQTILDYLGDTFKDCLGGGFHHPDGSISEEQLLGRAFKFIEEEYDKRKRMQNNKLALRYYLLYNYFKARIQKQN